MNYDILIVGTGCSGLYFAMNIPDSYKILMVTKKEAELSDSFLAQGGICMLKDESDYDSYFQDTMKAGHYENDIYSVEIMIRSSPEVIADLISYGVNFQRNEDGSLAFTREGAHSHKRILYHEDITGQEITSHLLNKVRQKKNVTIMENTPLVDLIVENDVCLGGVIEISKQKTKVYAKKVILATGGIGGLYQHSTNYRHLTGDAIELAKKYKIELKNLDYVQIHPTTLFTRENERSFLISESVRGEGAKLLSVHGERFVDELQPRDIVAEAIFKQMEKDHSEYVYEDLRAIDPQELKVHFPHIIEHCKEKGYDVFKEPIPVVPAQHYFMGGIKVDYDSHTSMKHLYAVGETACNGVHGKNRLASNSLLESLVFAKRAAKRVVKSLAEKEKFMFDQATLKLNVDPLILSALKEDITSEDVSTNCVMDHFQLGVVDLICKEDGVICGLQVFSRVFELLDPHVSFEYFVKDGDTVEKGQMLGRIKGDIKVLLSGERVALNYLQRMSGIATYTHEVVKYFKGSKVKLLDTRKTTPNNRIFEKYAVRVGGGHNHRYNLSDGVLLKDNHIGAAGGIRQAVMMAKDYAPFVRKIEVEVETIAMVKEALEAKADIIMLDNMNDQQLQEAIALIDHRAEIEISGNVTKENVSRLIQYGVDYISSGALTHSAKILDLSLKNLHAI
ncbi:L-aspartate oxidase [[Clostridium] spiroforme]|nr:L-aspartate oxidase [Thomasclavelia spiroformis]MBM6880132.1 L-aspartate oxidase [Thomasclavelia spiroformis]